MVFSGLNIWNGVRQCREEQVSTPCEMAIDAGAIAGSGAVSAGAGLILGALTTGVVACTLLLGAPGVLWGVSWVATSYMVENDYISAKTQSLLLLLSGAILAAAIALTGLALGCLSLTVAIVFGAMGGVLALTATAGWAHSLYISASAIKYNEPELNKLENIRQNLRTGFPPIHNSSADCSNYSHVFIHTVHRDSLDADITLLISHVHAASREGKKVGLDILPLDGRVQVTFKST